MTSNEDVTLLLKVAFERDPQAFAEVYRQHEAASYGLAFRITGDRERAEEAVQEAMLRVWQAARSFEVNSEGTVRAWILRIVARESLMVLRHGKRVRNEKEREMTRDRNGEELAPHTVLERDELLARLRGLLDGLPDMERKLLALHFGGGLSHQEIGTALEMPRRTISYKIEESLKRLREGLVRAGLATAFPLVAGSSMGEAICSGYAAPAGLQTKVLDRIAHAGHASCRRSARADTAAKITWPTVVVVTCAVLATAAWLLAGRTPSSQSLPSQIAPVVIPKSPEADALYAKWTFEKGPAADLEVVQGEWAWNNDPKANLSHGAMTTPVDPGVAVVVLPTLLSSPRFLISVKIRSRGIGKWGFASCWLQRKKSLSQHTWSRFLDQIVPPNALGAQRMARVYYLGRYVIHMINNEAFAIDVIPENRPADRVLLALRNWHVEEIELRSLREDEVPADLRDPERLLAHPKAKGWTRGTGETPLTEPLPALREVNK